MANYTGHKNIAGVFQKIINNIPAHKVYCELFAGSASVLSLITVPADRIILNDLDPFVSNKLISRFPNTLIYSINAIDFLKKGSYNIYNNPYNDFFFFLDPPYLHSTRTNKELYRYEMSDSDHVQLLNVVLQSSCNVMIIHPKCKLYDTMLKDWRKVEIKIRYHRKTSIEYLYMNYEAPTQLQCYDYLGDDCWERQRISRKVKGYKNKFKKMPVLEKNYILQELNKL